MRLCALLDVEQPKPTDGASPELNDYCFERGVRFKEANGSHAVGLTILALARLGHLSSTDNGQTFALRRVG